MNEALPQEPARRLVGMARAVRLLVEAAEPEFAKTVVDDIEKLVASAESDPWIVMVTRHLELVRKCL